MTFILDSLGSPRARRALPWAVLAMLFTIQAASAAAVSGSGKTEATLIAEIVLLLLVGRLLGEAMERLGQPSIMGQLLAGIILGPSLFGWVWPEAQKAIFPSDPAQKSMLDAISQIGILMLLLLTGMETDLKLVRRVGTAALTISATGILVPFACGVALAMVLPEWLMPHGASRIVVALFLGTALSISSIKIVATVVREMGFIRRNLGQIIVGSAILEDTIGWVIIAVTLGIAQRGTVDARSLLFTVAGVAIFLAASLTIGRRLVFVAIRWVNDNFKSEFPVITAILVIMGVMALITQALGVHTVLGAFVAGVLIGESPILTKHIEEQLRGLIAAFFMPIFFGLSGISADLTILAQPQYLALTAGLVLIASVGKFSGAFVGGKLGGMTGRESFAIGCAMNARGSTEIIVASIGLAMGALTKDLFTAIVTMAILTTTAMPPMLRRALDRVPVRPDEKERMAREEIDERGFIPKLERLLLAVDDSRTGRFTARLAGFLAGAHGMPMTIVHFKDAPKARRFVREPSREVKEGAKQSAAAVTNPSADDGEKPEKVHLTTRVQDAPDTEAVAQEASKGFDLLLIGMKSDHDADGQFSPDVSEVVTGFRGPYAIVTNCEAAPPRLDGRARILVPVNGTDAARRAAEIAFAIARPTQASVVALYVTGAGASGRQSAAEGYSADAVLRDIARLADRYDVALRTQKAVGGTTDAAILRAAARGYDLLVMAVTPRTGDALFFGKTATAVLTKRKGATMFVAT